MNGRERQSRSPGGALFRQWHLWGTKRPNSHCERPFGRIAPCVPQNGVLWAWLAVGQGKWPYSGGVWDEMETFCFILEVSIGEKIAIRGFLMG